MTETDNEPQFSFKSLFIPFTTFKAIHWLIVLGIVVYANMLFNSFVWDDLTFILNNPVVKTIDLTKILGHNLFNTGGFFRPLFVLYFAIFYQTFGATAFPYHLAQLVLHITNTCLLFFVFKHFFNHKVAFIPALIFLIHPIQVESVSYISATHGNLSFIFGISALLVTFKKQLQTKHFLIISFLLLCSLLTKETGFVFAGIIGLYILLFKKNYIVPIVLGIMGALAIYCVWRFVFAGVYFEKMTFLPLGRLTFVERLYLVPAVFFYYLQTFFFPKDLITAQHWLVTQLTWNSFYLPLFLDLFFLSTLFFFGWYLFNNQKRHFKLYVFFGSWFLLGMLLHSQLMSLDMTVADRWFYFDIVGLLGCLTLLVQALIKHKFHKIMMILLIIVVLILSFRTMIRNSNWKNESTLFLHDIQYNDSSYDLEINAGAMLYFRGQKTEARKHIEKSLKLNPYYWSNWHNMGTFYYHEGNYQKAEECYLIAIKNNKYYIHSYIALAKIMIKHDNPKKTESFLLNSLELAPQSGDLLYYLALHYYKNGEQQKALETAQQAYQFKPTNQILMLIDHIQKHEPIDLQNI